MGQIKVVLIFNEDDERQREAGEYLKTKKRCKTALVTELVHAWMKNGETAVNTVSSIGSINIEDIKKQLLQDKDFISRIEKSMTETGDQNKPEAESEDNEKFARPASIDNKKVAQTVLGMQGFELMGQPRTLRSADKKSRLGPRKIRKAHAKRRRGFGRRQAICRAFEISAELRRIYSKRR